MKRFNTKIGCLKLEESLFLKPRSGSYSGRDKSIQVIKKLMKSHVTVHLIYVCGTTAVYNRGT